MIKPLKNYNFPVVELPATTSLEAVCQVFETLNKTGMKLTVFDLLTAKFWPQNVNLRALLARAREEYPLLGKDEFDVDATFLLQAISLLRIGTCKRGDLLLLDHVDFEEDWRAVCRAASAALALLKNECGVLTRAWLPYVSLLPSLFAIATQVLEREGPEVGAAWEKVTRWFWCSCFGQRYDGPPNTLNAADLSQVLQWIDDDKIPEAVAGFSLASVDLRRAAQKRNAIYRSVICLTIVHGARDFHTGNVLSADALKDPTRKIEDHHLFPSSWLKKLDPPRPAENSILNRALIDYKTNKRISDKAPSAYLGEIATVLGGEKLEAVLESHLIPTTGAGALPEGDVDAMLAARERLILGAIATVTGAVAPEEPNREAYLDPRQPFTNELALRRILRELRGHVLWYEQHMTAKTLELLIEELDGAVTEINLLSGPAHITEEVQRRFERFSVELKQRDIEAEWRVLPPKLARELHARVLFDDETIWELPPLNSLLMGTVDSIRPSAMPRTPFEEAWQRPEAQPLAAVALPATSSGLERTSPEPSELR